MNCRPGDLARIVGTHPGLQLNDKIVKLADEPAFMQFGLLHWKLDPPVRMVMSVSGFSRLTGEHWNAGQRVVLEEVPDCNLRPIRDPGDDAVDETLIYAGDPRVREVVA